GSGSLISGSAGSAIFTIPLSPGGIRPARLALAGCRPAGADLIHQEVSICRAYIGSDNPLAQGKAMRLPRKSGAWDKADLRGCAVIVLAATAVAGLAACSSSSVNPVELYRSAAGFTLNDDTSGERNAQNLAAGSNEPYPNLGTVPPPPDRAMSSIDRRKLQQGLTEDRTEAKQSDADLRDSSTAMAAPTPITRPSATGDGAATDETKHKGASQGGRPGVSTARHAPAGSAPAPQESALNSPDVHAIPEGDTPRPAPPPPYLPPAEKTRKSSPGQAGKPAPSVTAATRPSPTPPAMAPPPPPPSDLAMPPPNSVAALTPVPPATLDPLPSLPPAAATDAPGAASPVPLGATDAQRPSAEQTATPDPARSPPAAVPVPVPAPPQAPKQEATLSPAPQAAPPASKPELTMATPQRTGRGGTVSLQAAEINFTNNGMTLSAEDDQRLAGVVKLYDKHGGIVRVVGYGRRSFGADAAQQELASFSKAIERANVVARALAQLGLASNRIVVQAAPVGDGLGEDRAEVLLEF